MEKLPVTMFRVFSTSFPFITYTLPPGAQGGGLGGLAWL